MEQIVQALQQHIAELRELRDTNTQCNYDDRFASLIIFDGSKRDESFKRLESLEVTGIQGGRDIYADILRKSRGSMQDCLLSMPEGQHLRDSSEEHKRCFSDFTSRDYVDSQSENMHQKLEETLRTFICRYSKIQQADNGNNASDNNDPFRSFRHQQHIDC